MPRASVLLPPATSADDKADRANLLSALQKTSRRESLTAPETAAYRRHLKQQEEQDRWAYYRTIPQKHWREMSGRQTKVLQDVQGLYGIPVAAKIIDLPMVVRAFHDFLAKHGSKLIRDSEDPLMVGPGSPALEKYRAIKAKREQFAHERELGQHRSLDEVATVYNQFSAALKQACETIQRQNLVGGEAVQQLRETLSAFRQSLISMLGEQGATLLIAADDSDGKSTSESS